MKRILVVSDNAPLVRFFKEECISQDVNKIAETTYRYTAPNKNPSDLVALGATPIDLKNHQLVSGLVNSYDLIFSLHCKQIFPAELVAAVRCVNVHPGLNPYNRGWYPQVFSLINGEPIGATIHLMDHDIDHGEVIDQVGVEILSSDTSLDVYSRVIDAEKKLIRKNIINIILEKYSAMTPSSEGNYNSIEDFKKLCKLDLDSVGTIREHIDLLRALSHGIFKNAFFLDEHGDKVFISVALEKEVKR